MKRKKIRNKKKNHLTQIPIHQIPIPTLTLTHQTQIPILKKKIQRNVKLMMKKNQKKKKLKKLRLKKKKKFPLQLQNQNQLLYSLVVFHGTLMMLGYKKNSNHVVVLSVLELLLKVLVLNQDQEVLVTLISKVKNTLKRL